jgi:benzoyl-CoA 2,3-dioxygenase component B
VPGEYRNALRRIIVTQADTEPASVEQQRYLGATAPSLYDLRNLFQVNVEEGRHLWAMVYLLHAHFGRDGPRRGRRAAGPPLRRPRQAPHPRRLQPEVPRLVDLLLLHLFTDRDGKYQLGALAESGSIRSRAPVGSCSPRRPTTCSSGDGRGARAAPRLQLAKLDPNGDARQLGGIDVAPSRST